MKKFKAAILSLFSAVIAAPALAAPVVLDFDSVRVDNDEPLNNEIGDKHEEDGFFVAIQSINNPFGLATVGTLAPNYTGSPALFSRFSENLIILGQIGLEEFDLISIDLSNFDTADGGDVTFTGNIFFTDDMGMFVAKTVYQTFTIDDYFGMQTFLFSDEFRNLTTVTWYKTAPFHQFDNIVVEAAPSSVPAPAAFPLLVTGLAGLLAAARRRKSRARSVD